MTFSRISKTLLLAAVLLDLGGGSMAHAYPKRYLLPDWYTGKVEPSVSGGRLLVKARLEAHLATMKNASVRLEPGKGLKLIGTSVSSSVSKSETAQGKGATVSSQTAVSSSVSASSGAKSGSDTFKGDLPPGGKVTIENVYQIDPGLDHAFVTLAFDFDFPVDEILAYIDQHKQDLYPEPDLREILIRAVKEQHAGRKTEGITERIDLKAGGNQ